MHYYYTRGRCKNMLHRFPPNKCFKFLLLSLKSLLQKRGMGYAKVIHKKKRKEKNDDEKKMDTKVSEIFKTMGT